MRSGEGSVQDGRGMGRGVFKMKGEGGGECSKWKGGGGSGGGGGLRLLRRIELCPVFMAHKIFWESF